MAPQDSTSDRPKQDAFGNLPNGHPTYYRWSEIGKHTSKSSRWLVIEDKVYDVTSWSKKHPGGSVLLGHFAGQDATEAFRAFHQSSIDYVRKFMKPLLIGQVDPSDKLDELELKEDFEQLRLTATKMGLFDSSGWFFGLMFLHFALLQLVGYLILYHYGIGWTPYILSVLLYATSQVQSDWYQHDIGHHSVFKNTSWNRVYHAFVFCILKGVSAKWWNHMHYQHHSKPNVIDKDPDMKLDVLFVLGEKIPLRKARDKPSWKVPYNYQHKYFSIVMPPLLFPVYFQIMNWRYVITRGEWLEGLLIGIHHAFIIALHAPLLGFWGFVIYYEVVRVVESIWFTWVSQSNHIPMAVDDDKPYGGAWLREQLAATCNIEKSAFNDWFTGHLNFQIEHHLFPQMPRHNYYKVTPLVKSLCEKHGVKYHVKSLSEAFGDILGTLKKSGQIWLHAYQELHGS